MPVNVKIYLFTFLSWNIYFVYRRSISYVNQSRLTLKSNNINKKKGFTLAEVLITLFVIGVIAAMTIPTLIQNIRDNQYKTRYRKAYSVVSQAFQSALVNKDLVELTGIHSVIGGEAEFDAIKQYFIIQKECDADLLSECWADSDEINFRKISSLNSQTESFIDNSGMSWKSRTIDNVGPVPGILVDTNGLAKPNKLGQDRFIFFYANNSMTSSDVVIDNIGMPVKIVPLVDVTDSVSFLYEGMDAYSHCPSIDSHPCYYTSWLTD